MEKSEPFKSHHSGMEKNTTIGGSILTWFCIDNDENFCRYGIMRCHELPQESKMIRISNDDGNSSQYILSN